MSCLLARTGPLVAALALAASCSTGAVSAPRGSDAAAKDTAGQADVADVADIAGGAGARGAAGSPRLDAAPPADAAGAPGGRDGSTTGPGPCALCDDFESAPVGGKPDPTRWAVGAPDLTGTGTLAIDDAQHHAGARSVKVMGQGGYSNHIFFTNRAVIGTLGPVVWARFYLRLGDALGDGHVTFLAMSDGADGGKHLRMGGQSKILMWNRESDDATLPALSPTGIAASEALPANRWLCVELMIDGRAGLMRTWVDGAELAGLHLDETPTPDVDEQWLRRPGWRPSLTDFALGWESYSGQAMTLWFDDVALGAARVGCL